MKAVMLIVSYINVSTIQVFARNNVAFKIFLEFKMFSIDQLKTTVEQRSVNGIKK